MWFVSIPTMTFSLRKPILFVLAFLPLHFSPVFSQEEKEVDPIQTHYIQDDDVYTVWNRIREGFKIPNMDNSIVEENLRKYSKNPAYLNRMAQRSKPFLYHIIEEVERRNLPTEIALLPFVESAFVTKAESRAKAAGLWQFMPATGKHFSLDQNMWRDDRYDVFESTNAALTYLERLYSMFGDWQLALAAYNWGEGNLSRAIKRNQAAGKPTDYMSLRMPAETRNYYPKLQAIKEIVQDPKKFNLDLPLVYNEPSLIEIYKNQDIDLDKAAKFAGLSKEEFLKINPSFNRPVIVASHKNRLLLHTDDLDTFVENLVSYSSSGKPLSSWTTYRFKPGDTLASVAKRAHMTEASLREANKIPRGRRVTPGSLLLVNRSSLLDADNQEIAADTIDASIKLQSDFRRVTYRVRKGDTINRVAKRLGVSRSKIMKENRLRSSKLRVGQTLVVSVPVKTRSYATQKPSRNTKSRFYVVRKGDTLHSIANRFDVPVNALRNANHIQGNRINVGQRLAINESGVAPRTTQPREKLPSKVERQIKQRPLAKQPTYRVKKGDTLFSIASSANMSVNSLKKLNGLKGNNLRVGQKLRLK